MAARCLLLGWVLLGLSVPGVVEAHSWRCGARLVGEGQAMGEVYRLCGEPTEHAAWTEHVTIRVSYALVVTRPVAVEEWIYNRGPKQFVRYLTFRDGILVTVDEGSYGY